MLRMFLEPVLDVLMRVGTGAYLPLPRSDRCLQLMLTLLHACSPEASRTRDGEDDAFPGRLAPCLVGVSNERRSLTF